MNPISYKLLKFINSITVGKVVDLIKSFELTESTDLLTSINLLQLIESIKLFRLMKLITSTISMLFDKLIGLADSSKLI